MKTPWTYYPLKAVLYCWSLLPLPLLYLQSSMFAFLLHRVVGYRKAVIRDNLRQAFPEKTETEINRIQRDFYRHFCDVIIETLKQLSMGSEALKRRVVLTNPEILPEMTAHGGGGLAIFAHYANWEWLGSGLGLQLPFPTVGVYQTLSSKVFDRLVLHIRTRHGNEMITMQQTYRESLRRLRSECYIGLLGDQSPAPHGKLYFTPFLGRIAAVHLGIATICLKMNVPLYYFDIRKVGRGRYEVTFRKIPHEDLDPKDKESVHRLTKRHVGMLEEVIRTEPAYWLWSHRRWKRSPKPGDIVDMEKESIDSIT